MLQRSLGYVLLALLQSVPVNKKIMHMYMFANTPTCTGTLMQLVTKTSHYYWDLQHQVCQLWRPG